MASRASDDVKLVMYFPAEALHNAAYYKVQQGERRHISCLDEGSSGCDRPMTTASAEKEAETCHTLADLYVHQHDDRLASSFQWFCRRPLYYVCRRFVGDVIAYGSG